MVQRAYSAAADEHIAFWKGLKDHEFFGSRVRHIYFYSPVTEESVLQLRRSVLDACRDGPPTAPDPAAANHAAAASSYTAVGSYATAAVVRTGPKPIVVHIHSPGGSVLAENWLLSMFNQVDVPLCAMVDSWSASAATALSVMAPYRVGTPFSVSLLHDYSTPVSVRAMEKRENALARQAESERQRDLIKRLYLARTRVTETQLEALLRRDIWLSAETCLRMGIYDRIVWPDRASEVSRFMASSRMAPTTWGPPIPFVRHNWNNVYAVCQGAEVASQFDSILASPDVAMKPIVFITPGGAQCDNAEASLSVIARIRASPVPVYGVIDNVASWWQVMPVLFCHRRYMYENAVINSDMQHTSTWGLRINDIVHNVALMRKLITSALRQQGSPSKKFIDDMFDRPQFITASECLSNGIVDEVIPLVARHPAQAAEYSKTPKRKTEKLKTPKRKTEKLKTPKLKTPKLKTPKLKTPTIKTPKRKTLRQKQRPHEGL
jgi:ATP-dependent protease ClpP protease subunit